MIHIPQLRKQAQPGPATDTKHSFSLVALGAGLAFSVPPPLLFLFMPQQLLIQPPWLWSARWLQICSQVLEEVKVVPRCPSPPPR